MGGAAKVAPESHEGQRSRLARAIARAPVVFLLAAPLLCLILFGLGLRVARIEDQLDEIWMLQRGKRVAHRKYEDSLPLARETPSILLTISSARDEGNIVEANKLLEVRDKLRETQNVQVVVDGVTFYYSDVCPNVAPYVFPCIQISAIECFAEGDYAFGTAAETFWRNRVSSSMVAAKLPAAIAVQKQRVTNYYVGYRQCQCEDFNAEFVAAKGVSCAIASFLGGCDSIANASMSAGFCARTCHQCSVPKCNMSSPDWESDDVCMQCIENKTALWNQRELDEYYYTAGPSVVNQSMTDAQYDQYVADSLSATLDAAFDSQLLGETPYSFSTTADNFGRPRPAINDTNYCTDHTALLASILPLTCAQAAAASMCPTHFCPTCPLHGYCDVSCGFCNPAPGLSDEEDLLLAVSKPCYFWDDGTEFDEVDKTLTIGGVSPKVYDQTNPLRQVKALMHTFPVISPRQIVERVSSGRPFGNVAISERTAVRIIALIKDRVERIITREWDDDSTKVLFTAFSDGNLSPGTLSEEIVKVSKSSFPLSCLAFATTLVVAVLLCSDLRDPVESQGVFAIVATLESIVCLLGSFGVVALLGISYNIAQVWVLPFVMIGLGMDDMFILSLEAAKVGKGAAPDEVLQRFETTVNSVVSPITLTSLVNLAALMSMSTLPIPAVSNTAVTGMICIVLMYASVLTSISAFVLIDLRRRANKRPDFIACLWAGATSAHQSASDCWKIAEDAVVAFLTSARGQLAVAAVVLLLISTAVLGLCNIAVGLPLEDFFERESPAGQFVRLRDKYFGFWHIKMNWGQIDYTDPDIQLQMIKQWETVQQSPYVSQRSSSQVWVAALALWALPTSLGAENCDTNNMMTGGRCGPVLDATCTSTLVPNVYDLKLTSDGGICIDNADLGIPVAGSRCPVLSGLSETQFAHCVELMKTHTRIYDLLNPSLVSNDDGSLALPFKFSSAGTDLYSKGIQKTSDYLELMKFTDKACDDIQPECWMSGTPYTYFEQYFFIQEWLVKMSALGIGVASVVALLMLSGEFFVTRGLPLATTLRVSIQATLIIMVMLVFTFVIVVGVCSALGVKVCGLSAMSYLLAIAFSVEYAVHMTYRFILAPEQLSAQERAVSAVRTLFKPTFMSFTSSIVGISLQALSPYAFVITYFFMPIFVVQLATAFNGLVLLPVLLQHLSCIGLQGASASGDNQNQKVVKILVSSTSGESPSE